MDDTDDFLAFRGEIEAPIRWEDPPDIGRRAAILLEAQGGDTTFRPSPALSEDPSSFGWDDLDEGPPGTDESWAAFEPMDYEKFNQKALSSYGGKKLSKEQKVGRGPWRRLASARERLAHATRLTLADPRRRRRS